MLLSQAKISKLACYGWAVLFNLYPFQIEAVAAVKDAWGRGVNRPAIQVPTGGGKTLIFSTLAVDEIEAGGRPVVLVHSNELIKQAKAMIEMLLPNVRVGVVKADRREWASDIVVASVPTLASIVKASRKDRPSFATQRGIAEMQRFTLIIADEAHLSGAPTWIQSMQACGAFSDRVRSLGVSATLWRADGKLKDIWQEVVYELPITSLIRLGFLCDAEARQLTVRGLDLSGVRVSSSTGDLAAGSLGSALMKADVPRAVVAGLREHAQDESGGIRRSIIFSPTVECAEAVTDDLNAAGIPCKTIVGTTSEEDRALAYEELRTHKVSALSSVDVLTTGFDLPEVEVCVLARPTTSRALFIQMLGRVLRTCTWTGKTKALLIDVTGSAGKHKIVNVASLFSKERPDQKLPMKKKGYEGSIAELFEMQLEDDDHPEAHIADDPHLDLFSGSSRAWVQTPAGVWAIPTKDHNFVLWPGGDGKYLIVAYPPGSPSHGQQLHEGRTFSLPLAMSWAETAAEKVDPSISGKGSPWRRKKPGENLVALAQQMGIDVEGKKAGEVSQAVSTKLISRDLDHKYKELENV